MKLIDIIDLEFLIKLDHEGGPIISGQSRSLNISCHVRLNEKNLKSLGFYYLIQLTQEIKRNMAEHYQNRLTDS